MHQFEMLICENNAPRLGYIPFFLTDHNMLACIASEIK